MRCGVTARWEVLLLVLEEPKTGAGSLVRCVFWVEPRGVENPLHRQYEQQ